MYLTNIDCHLHDTNVASRKWRHSIAVGRATAHGQPATLLDGKCDGVDEEMRMDFTFVFPCIIV